MPVRTLVWFRAKDLRVRDHAPLRDAALAGDVIPLFVLEELPYRLQFLLDSIRDLDSALAERGSGLVIVRGESVEVVPRLAKKWRVDRVVAHRAVDPSARERDRLVRASLAVPFELYDGETLVPPATVRSSTGGAYSVFTPFARALRAYITTRRPVPAPKTLPALPIVHVNAKLPAFARDARLQEGGERAARARLRAFVRNAAKYPRTRDRMDLAGTSRLSADLKFGTLSIREVWFAIDDATFRKELMWREFTHATLWDRPGLLEHPFRASFENFPWRRDERAWTAWTLGNTGYPVVDASARQLLAEGFVHNRARMISASFLTKHLLIDYRRGEAHYMKFLTDGDAAQNNAGWQWSAGCGCDAQPYFRIFNPIAQAERFDPSGDYVRRWVPELGHASYPKPIVDHRVARERYLTVARRHLRARP